MSNADFTIEHPSIGLNNTTYANERAFGQAYVRLGPFRFTAYVTANGEVSLPSTLIDDATTLAVAEAVRAAVLEETRVHWDRIEQAERARFAQRTPRRCPSRPVAARS